MAATWNGRTGTYDDLPTASATDERKAAIAIARRVLAADRPFVPSLAPDERRTLARAFLRAAGVPER